MNASFCVLPFYRTTVRTGGTMAPCCLVQNYSNIKHTTVEEYWQGERINQLRADMLEGKLCDDCSKCYEEERSIGKSMRTESWRDHAVTSETDLVDFVQGPQYLGRPFPNYMEFHVGNLCNLKCLTCGPRDSSAFLVENNILKISNHRQEDFQIDDRIVEEVMASVLKHGVDVLDLRGGESMLVPSIRKILGSLPKNHNIRTLRLQTNCTTLDDFWKQTFQHFENVEIMMSIDAYGDANKYIRYPANWEDIEKNVDYFLSNPKLKLFVNCTVSNLNLLVLKPLIEWCRRKNIYFHYSLCSQPSYYHYTNLPKPLLEQGLQNLADCPEIVLSSNHNDQQWEDFCQMISTRDKHRRNSIFDILPELKPYWIDK